MEQNAAREHHYAPQFLLRNFATDQSAAKTATVGKSGNHAVWAERSIESIAVERDFYVHFENGIPRSVEEDINRQVESRISRSQT